MIVPYQFGGVIPGHGVKLMLAEAAAIRAKANKTFTSIFKELCDGTNQTFDINCCNNRVATSIYREKFDIASKESFG